MSKFKKFFYIVSLILICVVASPFVYMKIWQNSDIKFKTDITETRPIDAEITTTDPATLPSNPEDVANTEPEEEQTGGENSKDKGEQAEKRVIVFGKSDISYFDDALFIGDSRMLGISEYGTIKNADYFCSIGLSSYKIEEEIINDKTLSEVLAEKQYGKIYIMVGANEAGLELDNFVSSYRKMVGMVRSSQPDAVIYLMANLQVTAEKSDDGGYVTNEVIEAQNREIEKLADESSDRTYWLNVNNDFEDENGYLISDITSDGVHVYGKYYSKWCKNIINNTVISDSFFR